MRFIAEAASTEVDLRNEQFAPQALYQMAEQADGKEIPIVRDFNASDRVGFVTKVYVKNNRLVVEGTLHCELSSLFGSGAAGWERWVVPGFVIRDNYAEGGWVFTDVELVSFGLTDKPCDPTLKPLRKMEVKLCVVT